MWEMLRGRGYGGGLGHDDTSKTNLRRLTKMMPDDEADDDDDEYDDKNSGDGSSDGMGGSGTADECPEDDNPYLKRGRGCTTAVACQSCSPLP